MFQAESHSGTPGISGGDRKTETTTTTTFIASTILSPGDNTTKTYVWYPGNNATDIRYTVEMFFRRLNTRTGEAVYAAKTRIIVTTSN